KSLLEKLKLLGYEKGFIKGEKGRPIEKHSFIISRGSGQSFFSFVSLSSWLIRQSGNSSFPIPSEVDDPNTTISNINAFLRSREKGGDWNLARLKSGTGEEIVAALNQIADLALQTQSFTFRKPTIRLDEEGNTDDEDGGDSTGNESELEDGLAMDDDDDAALVDLSLPNTNTERIEGVLKNDLKTSHNWIEEVERVTPLLKIVIPDGKEWRVHMDKMVIMKGKMDQLKTVVGGKMNEMGTSMDKSIEVIESREKSLALQMDVQLGRLKERKDDLYQKTETYKSRSGGIDERNKNLESVSTDIRQIKEHIETEEAKSTDGAPLVKVRQSLLRLQEESIKLGVQCAVAEQYLLHSHLSERLTTSKNAYGLL
ncbi:hypothetical protein PFISCL1PPCAC_19761, partial [Pristionchus fissidentatus]